MPRATENRRLFVIRDWPLAVRAPPCQQSRSVVISGEQLNPYNHRPSRVVSSGLQEAKRLGLTRAIGVSNFSSKELEEAQAAMTKHAIVSNQVLYNLNSREIEQDLIPYCQENRITIMAYTPLADGSLTSGPRFRQDGKSKALDQVSAETGKTRAQVALNWCTSRSNVIAIPKSNRIDRTEENCGASGWRLSEEQLRLLEEAF